MTDKDQNWLSEIKFDANGLVQSIAQEVTSNRILMSAWMNRDSLEETLETGRAVYWSRSRKKLWRKGEESSHEQIVREVRLDCDGDVIILMVEQLGDIACHTGRASCFYRSLEGGQWIETDPVLKDPKEIYHRE
ncbi:MAG: phosphoribosyl-AMP cyclohydrolase [Gammaproteobacteria bacterium]|jgi:phosphoribosyl-AMP cyclohydrolase|nr:phosphoribosyl-AMP cyclohydrolase [Gammaproteobacteria bacterium]|tara:strand:- start:404 stop:805 length:402 start_codon:yes stop_codon:yes gene_type:complete